jgi:hypothetical protein
VKRACLLLLFAGSVVAAPASALQKDSLRQRFVKAYPDHLFIWPMLKQRSVNFDVRRRSEAEDFINFKPNNTFSLGLGLYVFDVGAELSLAIPLNEKSRSRFGASDVRDLQAHFVGKNWGVDLFSQRYSSFYLSNPEQTIRSNQPYPIRPDVELRNFGINGLYVFNKNRFSLRSAYNFAERQLQSGGSVVLAGTLNSVRLGSDSVVITPRLQSRLQLTNTFGGLRYTTISLAPGYSYNLIYRNWFINATASIGPAHHWVYYEDKDGRDNYDIAINSFVDSRAAIGYNSDRWFGGIAFVRQARQVRFDQFQFRTTNTSFKVLVGYRIVERGILKKRAWDFLPGLSKN